MAKIRKYLNTSIGTGRKKKHIESVGRDDDYASCIWVIKEGNTRATKILMSPQFFEDYEHYSTGFDGYCTLHSRTEPSEEEVDALIKTMQKQMRPKKRKKKLCTKV